METGGVLEREPWVGFLTLLPHRDCEALASWLPCSLDVLRPAERCRPLSSGVTLRWWFVPNFLSPVLLWTEGSLPALTRVARQSASLPVFREAVWGTWEGVLVGPSQCYV